MSLNPCKLIIDTDPGQDIDDLLALLFALKRPELDIKAITCAAIHPVKRARMVKRLLRYLDHPGVPVAAGVEKPLRAVSDEEWRSIADPMRTMNHYAFAEPEDPRDEPDSLDAVGVIIDTIERHPGEIVLACIAPLTNIACALRRNPDIAPKIKYIAMMGGETAMNRIEHNVHFDYVAADIVLGAGVPVHMGTWDVTRRFSLSMEECRRFDNADSPLLQAVGKAVRLWHPVQNWKPGPVMYDMFPLVHAFDRGYYTTVPAKVQIEMAGELTRGMTVIVPGEPNAEVTTDINIQALKKLFLDTVFE